MNNKKKPTFAAIEKLYHKLIKDHKRISNSNRPQEDLDSKYQRKFEDFIGGYDVLWGFDYEEQNKIRDMIVNLEDAFYV